MTSTTTVTQSSNLIHNQQIEHAVRRTLADQPIVDMHTHLFPPTYGTPVANAAAPADPGGLMLWGVDELVNYHYLVAEVFRVVPASKLPYEQFWKMSTAQRADHIWKHLFRERTPLSEACRGVITAITKLGLDPSDRDLTGMRRWTQQQNPSAYIDRVMELSNVSSITMTNSVFDDGEQPLAGGRGVAGRFSLQSGIANRSSAEGLAGCLPQAVKMGLRRQRRADSGNSRRGPAILREWVDRMNAIYIAVSLPRNLPIRFRNRLICLNERDRSSWNARYCRFARNAGCRSR